MTVAVVDTGSGNLRSVEKALAEVGARVVVTGDPDAVARADKLVVPGQGAFGACVRGLGEAGGDLRTAVLDAVRAGKPFLGICLGLQILFDASDESPGCAGLGLLRGRVVRFRADAPGGAEADGGAPGPAARKIPHMGWNACALGAAAADSPILRGIADGTYFYFVHSYYPVPDDASVVALWSDYGVRFCAAVAREHLFACQFHPEKSQRAGLQLLRNFVTL